MRRLAFALAMLLAAPALAQAPASTPAPTPADLLFERSHWKEAAPGTAISYRYARTTGAPDVFGPPFEDTIRLRLQPSTDEAARTVAVDFFSGPRRRAAGPFEDIQSNPVVLIFLEHHLETIAKVLKANPRYLKNAIRASMRDRAEVTAVTTSVGGREVPAWRVEVKPFLDDAMKERMRGLEKLTYRFVVSDAVPGALVSAKASAATPEGAMLLEEALTYDASAG
ncbi:hypothetical protein [Salinarimonas soli]|uniref:Uncharacterized protein n=1 Tax=Salinarimonas soli TaxID=1638099 RepID=A0A5B2VH35_9HYPH|nr:hypothetical protein [Salinarimonas soli]KAA2237487.1 hypothetical protein F0L46_10890 [Salinarimonas soli]